MCSEDSELYSFFAFFMACFFLFGFLVFILALSGFSFIALVIRFICFLLSFSFTMRAIGP